MNSLEDCKDVTCRLGKGLENEAEAKINSLDLTCLDVTCGLGKGLENEAQAKIR